MKKALYLLLGVGLLLAGVMIISCKKDPPKKVLQPTVEMTVSPTGILPYGATCNVSWTSTNGKSITINNKSVGPVGSVADKLYRDTVYSITVTNENLSAKAEKEIKVGDWTTSDVGLLTHNYWLLKRIENYEDNNFIDSLRLTQTPERLTDKYYYYLSGKYEVFHATGTLFGGGTWSLAGKTLVMISRSYEVLVLSQKSFSIRTFFEILPNGKSSYQVSTYWRP